MAVVGVRMLRAGGWDGTAGKRSRGCQRAHARHGQEYATEAGVAWQGQGMLAIWRGGQHAGRAGDVIHPKVLNYPPGSNIKRLKTPKGLDLSKYKTFTQKY